MHLSSPPKSHGLKELVNPILFLILKNKKESAEFCFIVEGVGLFIRVMFELHILPHSRVRGE